MSTKVLDVGEQALKALQEKHPTLNLELAPLDEEFIPTHTEYCDTLSFEAIQDSHAVNGADAVKVSLISNLDLSNLEVGTKVTIGNFIMEFKVNADRFSPEGVVAIQYKI